MGSNADYIRFFPLKESESKRIPAEGRTHEFRARLSWTYYYVVTGLDLTTRATSSVPTCRRRHTD